jgi:hypothetical protein
MGYHYRKYPYDDLTILAAVIVLWMLWLGSMP